MEGYCFNDNGEVKCPSATKIYGCEETRQYPLKCELTVDAGDILGIEPGLSFEPGDCWYEFQDAHRIKICYEVQIKVPYMKPIKIPNGFKYIYVPDVCGSGWFKYPCLRKKKVIDYIKELVPDIRIDVKEECKTFDMRDYGYKVF